MSWTAGRSTGTKFDIVSEVSVSIPGVTHTAAGSKQPARRKAKRRKAESAERSANFHDERSPGPIPSAPPAIASPMAMIAERPCFDMAMRMISPPSSAANDSLCGCSLRLA